VDVWHEVFCSRRGGIIARTIMRMAATDRLTAASVAEKSNVDVSVGVLFLVLF
jgi:hypothetical protein